MSEPSPISSLVDHLFRHESGKLVSVLTRIFGVQNLELAEDVVQDALTEALEIWQYKGIPDNPSAWLFRVAKNKALNVLNREKSRKKREPELTGIFGDAEITEAQFSDQAIQDDQLRMIFTCCHPAISADSQIALALKTLCGFSIPEIARSFLTTEENIHKRLVRARQSIREAGITFDIILEGDLENRLNTVLETIYILFNEGYSASRGNDIIRYELCEEAIRLAQIILANQKIKHKENVHALLALMFINASRFKARQGDDGQLLNFKEQDRSLWDMQMLDIGLMHLSEAAKNDHVSNYLIMATISAQYCIAPSYAEINWKNILNLYDSLVLLDPSPVILLNRSIALSEAEGDEKALQELYRLRDNPVFKGYHLFYAAEAQFQERIGDFGKAKESLEKAINLAPLEQERLLLEKKLENLKMKMA